MVDRLVQTDPLTPVTHLVLGIYMTLRGRNAEAVAPSRRAIETAPGASILHVLAAWQLVEAGLADEGRAELRRVATALGDDPWGSWARLVGHAVSGDENGALAEVTPAREEVWGRVEFCARTLSQAFAMLGRTDDAVRWLRTAAARGFINYPHMMEHDPFMVNVREAPAFRELIEHEVKPRWERVVAWETEWHAGRRVSA